MKCCAADRGSSKNASRLLDYHRVIQELKLPNNSKAKNSSQLSVKSGGYLVLNSNYAGIYAEVWCFGLLDINTRS